LLSNSGSRIRHHKVQRLPVYVEDVNQFGENINTTKNITKILLDDNKELHLEVNTYET